MAAVEDTRRFAFVVGEYLCTSITVYTDGLGAKIGGERIPSLVLDMDIIDQRGKTGGEGGQRQLMYARSFPVREDLHVPLPVSAMTPPAVRNLSEDRRFPLVEGEIVGLSRSGSTATGRGPSKRSEAAG